MNDYLLFIDTEASGLPRKWNQPYSKENNWPHSVQISWLVYTRDGRELKREDHYIGNNDFRISDPAIKIHGITRDFLNFHGVPREDVLKQLVADLNFYKPLVVGHFIELDYHVLAADFYRAKIQNPIEALSLPAFCTMMATSSYALNPAAKYLRLGELYYTLFNRQLEKPHNAIYDAKATADCFFSLLEKGEITDEHIEAQKLSLRPNSGNYKSFGWMLAVLIFILVILLVAYGFSQANRIS